MRCQSRETEDEEQEQIVVEKNDSKTTTNLQKKYSFNPHELSEKIKESIDIVVPYKTLSELPKIIPNDEKIELHILF